MRKHNVKEFIKNHKKEIVLVAAGTIVGTVCGYGIRSRSELSYLDKVGANALCAYIPTSDEVLTIGTLDEPIKKLMDSNMDPDTVVTGIGVFLKK